MKPYWGLFNGLQFSELIKISLKIFQSFIYKGKNSDNQAQICFTLSQIRLPSEKHFTSGIFYATKIPFNKFKKKSYYMVITAKAKYC